MTAAKHFRSLLAEGRSPMDPGHVHEVVSLVFARPRDVDRLIECLWDEDPGVANRAADALERVSAYLPAVLTRWKAPLLGLLADASHNKLRWNLALIIPRLPLTVAECRRVAETLNSWLDDKSSIVKTLAMQGLADLTRQDPAQLPTTLDLLRVLSRSGTPAMRARGRILLKRLEKKDAKRHAPGARPREQRPSGR